MNFSLLTNNLNRPAPRELYHVPCYFDSRCRQVMSAIGRNMGRHRIAGKRATRQGDSRLSYSVVAAVFGTHNPSVPGTKPGGWPRRAVWPRPHAKWCGRDRDVPAAASRGLQWAAHTCLKSPLPSASHVPGSARPKFARIVAQKQMFSLLARRELTPLAVVAETGECPPRTSTSPTYFLRFAAIFDSRDMCSVALIFQSHSC
jgi:hypothetical protein